MSTCQPVTLPSTVSGGGEAEGEREQVGETGEDSVSSDSGWMRIGITGRDWGCGCVELSFDYYVLLYCAKPKKKDVVRSIKSSICLYFPPGTIKTITITQIVLLRTLAQAPQVKYYKERNVFML